LPAGKAAEIVATAPGPECLSPAYETPVRAAGVAETAAAM